MALFVVPFSKPRVWQRFHTKSFNFCHYSWKQKRAIYYRTDSSENIEGITCHINANSCEPWFAVNELPTLSHKELQVLCKEVGIKATGSSKTLRQDLAKFHENNLSNSNSVLFYPFAKSFTNGSFESSNEVQCIEVPSSFPSANNRTLPFLVSVESVECWVSAASKRLCKTLGARGTRTATESFYSPKVSSLLSNNVPFLRDRTSVTTVLNATSKGKLYLLSKWRKKQIEQYGKEAFERYTSMVTRRGSMFHSYIASVLSGDTTLNIPQPISGLSRSIAHVLDNLSDVVAIEKKLFHCDLGYTGVVDTVACYRGIPCVVEWKTSEKVKNNLKDCYEYPIQCVAYAGAVNCEAEMKVSPPLSAIIVVAYADGRPANVHFMNLETCNDYWRQWLLRLFQYKNKLLQNSNS